MADKTFNEQPMIVVASDALDPRIKRQLQAQLQSTLMSVTEVNSEVEKQQALSNIKEQKAKESDNSEFDAEQTEDTPVPEPVENNADQTGQQPSAEEGNEAADDLFGQDGDQSGTVSDEDPNASDAQDNNPDDNQEQKPQEQAPVDDQQSGEGDQNQGQAQGQQNAQQNQQTQNSGQQPAATNAKANGNEGEDPFGDISFETFAGILGLSYKAESKSAESTLPPIKRIVYIQGTNQGVDNRTSAVIATIEDPENTIVIIDESEVGEIEAKMEFKALIKQLQSRGIMAVDSLDQAVEYLNGVYDELSA